MVLHFAESEYSEQNRGGGEGEAPEASAGVSFIAFEYSFSDEF